MIKMISWNVNGLRAVVGKGFMDIFKELDADIFCIQETKLQEGQIDLVTTSTGIMPGKKGILVPLCSPARNPCP